MRNQPGFTLAEVLLAVVLIDVGLLALVAGSAVLVRQTNELRLRNAAVRAASNRLQQLGAAPCVATTGGVSTVPGLREDWTLSLQPNGVRDVSDSVSFSIGRGGKSVVLRTRLPC